MPNESKKQDLVNFTTEEGELVSKDLDEVLKKYNAQFVVSPIINPNGTLGARVELFKKVEQEQPSPYNEATNSEAEESSESDSEESA